MFIYTFLTKQATFHISCHDIPEQQRWHERRREVRFSVLSDWLSCATSHTSLVVRGGGVGGACMCSCVRACVSCSGSLCMFVCMCTLMCPPTSRRTQTPSWVLKTMHILISLIIHPYVTDERILVSVSGTGNMRGGGARQRGEGRSSKPKWLCSCRSLNLPLCAAQGEMRHSPGLAPVMWRGIREMNVFRISNNQRIISTPSAFKSMDPSRLKRHFDWESKSSLPLDTKDNEVAAFPLLSFYCPRHVWCDCQLEVISPKSIISSADVIQFINFIIFHFQIALLHQIMSKSIINVNILIITRLVRFYSVSLSLLLQWPHRLASWEVMTCDIIMGCL